MKEFLTESFLIEIGIHYIKTKSISDLLFLYPIELFLPNKIEFNVIYLFDEGKGMHTVDFNSIEIKDKHILFVNQNQITQFHFPVNFKGRVLIFTENFFCQNNFFHTQFFGQTTLYNNSLNVPYFELKDRFEEVSSLFNFISEELKRPYYEEQSVILNNYLFNILLISENLYDKNNIKISVTSNKLLLSKFKSLANKNIHKHHKLEFYVKKLNVSLRTLQNAFLEEEKQTPKQWLINRIILEIKRNLAYQNKNISEIAYDFGFKEITNFTKFFKTKTGLTPSQFRKHFLEK
ncbi:helix-turn-helix domain-containing protein [Chryseobacterium joostei]|uniref:helix-turn-helix domain-containing protein n=1 Tax=Chryseobacterium joostei TaxID=112234 RepID=UPI003D0D9404